MRIRLVEGLIQLNPTIEDKRRAREALLRWLRDKNTWPASDLVRAMVQLDPTVEDLSNWRAWAASPTTDLLVAARRNSALADWLGALRSLPSLSD